MGALGLAMATIAIGWSSHTWPDFAGKLFGQAAAAWVQAVGVFVAVYLTGQMTRRHAEAQERARVHRQLRSTTAVIAQGLKAIDNVPSGLQLRAAGMLARDPHITLATVHEALTPMRIHELPDAALVTLCLDIKSDMYAIMRWLASGAKIETDAAGRIRLPVDVLDKLDKAKRECELFIRFANRYYP
jgi:hypothetical protein